MSNPSDLLESRLRAIQQELETKTPLEQASSSTNPIEVVADFNSQVAFSANVKKHNSLKPTRHFIDINDYQVWYHTGANIQYYTEYHARRAQEHWVSFPLNCCDPLPLKHFGNMQYFFTSAIEGNIPQYGEAYYFSDPAIKQVVVMRARADNGHWSQIYVGFDPDNFKLTGYKGSNVVHQGNILVIQYKDTQHVENRGRYLAPGVKPLDNMTMAFEVNKHLVDPKDFDWKSAAFREKMQELLSGVCFNWDMQILLSPTCYWTKEENKLKGIQYNHTRGARFFKTLN